MKRFARGGINRHYSMTHTVSYKNVPVPRGLAFALDLIDRNTNVNITLNSCIRVDSIIQAHNKQFNTNLHGQDYLYRNQSKPGFNPANPPNKTSHCWFSDGNPVYKKSNGKHAAATEEIVWYQVGCDSNEASEIIRVGNKIGFSIVRPYKSGGEVQHVVFTSSPIPLLEKKGTISKIRR